MRHLTALRGGSSSRQRLGEARSGVGRLGTVAGTLSTWGLNQREGAARSSNLATASARPLVTLTTDPCRLATYGRGNRVAAPPPHKQTPGGHRSVELPDAASAVPHRRIAAAAGARAGDLAGGPCGRSPPLGRVQARHGGPASASACMGIPAPDRWTCVDLPGGATSAANGSRSAAARPLSWVASLVRRPRGHPAQGPGPSAVVRAPQATEALRSQQTSV